MISYEKKLLKITFPGFFQYVFVIFVSQIIFMKKHPFFLVLAVVSAMSIVSCSKKASENPNSSVTNDEYVELRILEDKTNRPIADAQVRLEKCANYDPVFGCTSYSTISTLNTNNEGKYKFLKSLMVNRITAVHPKYWQSSNTGLADIKLVPEAFSRVHLKKVNNYSNNYSMRISASIADVFNMYPQETGFAIPADTTVYLRSYGNYENVVSWGIGTWVPIIQITKDGKSSPFFINAFDTSSVEINF